MTIDLGNVLKNKQNKQKKNSRPKDTDSPWVMVKGKLRSIYTEREYIRKHTTTEEYEAIKQHFNL